MDQKFLCSLIDERKDELFSLLSNLIKINSENFYSYGNEAECAKYVYDFCSELGLDSEIYSPMDIKGFDRHPDYFEGRGLENRYNVIARYCGERSIDELMLMAHTDTVKIGDLSFWDKDPLSGKIENGKIYGRGACDDKYALAAVMFLFMIFKQYGFKPKKNILFAAYCDEEYGGSHGALASVLKNPTNRIVNLDGRTHQIWNCASGGGEFKYYFRSKETLDSSKSTAKALSLVIDVIDEMFAEKRRAELNENPFYKGTPIPETSLRYMGCRAGYDGNDLGRGEAYFVFYTDKTKAEIYSELALVERALADKLDKIGFISEGFKPNTRFFHYAYCDPKSLDIRLMTEASREACGEELLVCGSCLSDLSVISKYGSDKAFAFGAGRDFSQIGGPHQPNEFIECKELLNFTKTIGTYILKVLG